MSETNGNIAAMREALQQASYFLHRHHTGAVYAPDGETLIFCEDVAKIVDAALAAPPRNCDVGTPAEQAERFHRYCRAHRTFFTECSASCPFTSAPDINHCQSGWAQMPYEAEKGGAE